MGLKEEETFLKELFELKKRIGVESSFRGHTLKISPDSDMKFWTKFIRLCRKNDVFLEIKFVF